MSVNITYFVHGTTTDNEKEISSGWSDVELSEKGIQQSIDLKEQTKDKKFDAIFTSDLQRAARSAELAWGGMYPIIPDTRLRECNYGELNAAPSAIVEPMQEEECITNRFPDGESYEDVRVRVSDFLEFLKQNYDGKNVAIVGHKAPQLALDVLIMGKTWKQALAEDWRKTKTWQPGWEYLLKTSEKVEKTSSIEIETAP
jgi:broad specificity phosphatase PhoE